MSTNDMCCFLINTSLKCGLNQMLGPGAPGIMLSYNINILMTYCVITDNIYKSCIIKILARYDMHIYNGWPHFHDTFLSFSFKHNNLLIYYSKYPPKNLLYIRNQFNE